MAGQKPDSELTTVFGPVPSRRLGQSLGIDPLPGGKTCNWNCVYCQLGRTRPLVNQRRAYVPTDRIAEDVDRALRRLKPTDVDWITFVASGETLLHSEIGTLIRAVKELAPYPVAVITNGSLLSLPVVRQDLLLADAVMPSLDAGTEALFKRITRHHPDLSFEQHVDGLVAFRGEYQGQLWLETMLMLGINDGEQELRDLAQVMGRIKPDSLQLASPTRPPVEPWVQPTDAAGLARARAILGEVVTILEDRPGVFELGAGDDPVDAVLGIIVRHPMREDLLREALIQWRPGVVDQALKDLERDPRAQVVDRLGCRFWSGSLQKYPDQKSEGKMAKNPNIKLKDRGSK